MKESDIQASCTKMLRQLKIPYFHIEGGKKPNRHIFKGFPDLVFWWYDTVDGYAKAFAVELKMDKGTVRPEQREWLDRLKSQGVHTGVCRSNLEFVDFLRLHGVIK